MSRKLLIVDRDGCLVVEPPGEQLDRFEKFDLMPGVIAALQRCVACGYELVMVTNQDGLGTDAFARRISADRMSCCCGYWPRRASGSAKC